MTDTPIEEYALLSNCQTAALVGRDGSVDWLCLPRFDAPSVFARTLDEDAGSWRIGPVGDHEIERAYRRQALVLDTTFATRDGAAVLTDALATGPNESGHELGKHSTPVLLRALECTRGEIGLWMDFTPCPEYGLIHPLLRRESNGLFGCGGPSVFVLSLPPSIELEVRESTAHAEILLGVGERVAFALQQAWSWEPPPTELAQDEIHRRLGETVAAWKNWSGSHSTYDGPRPELFGFLAMTALSQVRRNGEVQPVYGIGGEHDLTERELPHLSGWRGSRPVWVGNAAWNQRQLDVYGELVGAAFQLRDHLEDEEPLVRRFLVRLADTAATSWQSRDHGIWEMRTPAAHYVHSKLMCWVALDRPVHMAEILDAEEAVDRWSGEREKIRNAIESRGWSEELGSFRQTFDSDALDAHDPDRGIPGSVGSKGPGHPGDEETMSDTPIEEYALLSDCRTAALVSRDGSVDWLCLPRFDSPSLFGRLLDREAGSWRIRPTAEFRVERTYRDPSLILETTFETEGGTVVLRDALVTGPNAGGHDLGAEAPHALVRVVECVDGEVELELHFEPRPEYGLVHPLLRRDQGGLVGRGGASVLRLSTPMDLEVDGSTARSRFTSSAGDSAAFALQHCSTSEEPPKGLSQEEIRECLRETEEAWQDWSDLHQRYEGPWAELVNHSGRVLQGLTYHPTGAMVAAPTTSLPEAVGGERNWDYRYTWIRDASFTLDALWVAACPDEAYRFFDFLSNTALVQVRRGGELQVMFGIGGEHDLTERSLSHLSGWRDSRPVRIGNGAWHQRQLDVYGELLAAACRLQEYMADADPVTWSFLGAVADAAADRWEETDHSLWEIRGPQRHYVHSKLMCWVALDRALRMEELLQPASERRERWRETRGRIREAILERGWNDEVGAFTQCFDGRSLDASNLVMATVGFLPADDHRMVATVEATEDRLTDQRGLVYRYRTSDGLEGEEGTFLLCTFWLAEAWARAGEPERAREVFERAAEHANDMGLLSEEVDPESGALLGNFPQAFSHIGLVNAAWAIHRAEEGMGLT